MFKTDVNNQSPQEHELLVEGMKLLKRAIHQRMLEINIHAKRTQTKPKKSVRPGEISHNNPLISSLVTINRAKVLRNIENSTIKLIKINDSLKKRSKSLVENKKFNYKCRDKNRDDLTIKPFLPLSTELSYKVHTKTYYSGTKAKVDSKRPKTASLRVSVAKKEGKELLKQINATPFESYNDNLKFHSPLIPEQLKRQTRRLSDRFVNPISVSLNRAKQRNYSD